MAAALLAVLAEADRATGKVVGVSDGDAVTLLTKERRQVKVRIAGIDTPEGPTF